MAVFPRPVSPAHPGWLCERYAVRTNAFDCGSGAGILRSPEPVRLGHWNTISVYRHRWDAWLRLNNGKRVRGRSK
ncbi:hypothetical protein HF086_005297, partial [Spodoptera exigua]